MYNILIAFHILVSLLLIGAVLIQSGKGAASANIFGGSFSTENVFGAATPAILNRITTVLAFTFIITSLMLTIIGGNVQRSVIKRLGSQPTAPLEAPLPATAQPAAPVQQPTVPAPVQPPAR